MSTPDDDRRQPLPDAGHVPTTAGTVVSVRGSVVDIRFDRHLPPIYSVLRAGAGKQIIEHGRRIRACLKQSEFAPVSVPAQIAVLLALTAALFDRVPLDQMTDAERAVHEAAANIPADVCARFETAPELNAEDRKTIIDIARQALARFQPKPDAQPEAKAEPTSTPWDQADGSNGGHIQAQSGT